MPNLGRKQLNLTANGNVLKSNNILQMQNFIIFILFVAAIYYIFSGFYKQFDTTKSGCAKGCGSCGEMDIEKMAQKIEQNLK